MGRHGFRRRRRNGDLFYAMTVPTSKASGGVRLREIGVVEQRPGGLLDALHGLSEPALCQICFDVCALLIARLYAFCFKLVCVISVLMYNSLRDFARLHRCQDFVRT